MRHDNRGFTLIELLIVVVIIGILAAIAVTNFANSKERAMVAAMKTDLRNLVSAEEAYFSDSTKYTTTLGTGGANFTPSTGVTIAVTLGTGGWSASATHSQLAAGKSCAIGVGVANPLSATAGDGEPVCQ